MVGADGGAFRRVTHEGSHLVGEGITRLVALAIDEASEGSDGVGAGAGSWVAEVFGALELVIAGVFVGQAGSVGLAGAL